ncbi:MAG: DUF4249 domain-containing protein [Bacteroidetes bacterium]|nr:DUF4249 domain-containing protein [Bacteroidota bacterium]
MNNVIIKYRNNSSSSVTNLSLGIIKQIKYMLFRLNRITVLLLLTILFGCKDEVLLKSNSYTKILVVDGLISNNPGPYTVELSFSTPVNNYQRIPYQDCIVTLIENETTYETLKETEPGIYTSSDDGIIGIIGHTYSISIETPDGKEYYSKPQVMLPSIGIDSVYEQLTYKNNDIYGKDLPGYQFYLNSQLAENEDSYFLWKMIETFEYRANRKLSTMFNADPETIAYYMGLYRCWKTQKVRYCFAGKTANLAIPQIKNQPLHFVGTDTKRLQERYSLLVEQYSIDEEAYQFWKNIEDQFSQENFLTVEQPIDIVGNIRNINNQFEPVYGYFTVGSVSSKRIFVDRPRVDFYYHDECALNTDIEELQERTTPVFIISTNEGAAGVSEYCINCEMEGGLAQKPDFWID